MKVACWRFVLAAMLLVAASAAADEFDDYRIPKHDLIDWRLQLQFDADRTAQGGSYREGRDKGARGAASTGFSWLSDSDPMLTELAVAAGAAGTGFWSHENVLSPFVVGQLIRDQEGRSADESWNVGFEHRRYPWEFPFGASLRINAGGAYAQRWSDQRQDLRQLAGGVPIHDVGHN